MCEFEISRISILKLKPRDSLIVKSKINLSTATVERIKENLRRFYPDTPIIILDKDLDLEILRGE